MESRLLLEVDASRSGVAPPVAVVAELVVSPLAGLVAFLVLFPVHYQNIFGGGDRSTYRGRPRRNSSNVLAFLLAVVIVEVREFSLCCKLGVAILGLAPN